MRARIEFLSISDRACEHAAQASHAQGPRRVLLRVAAHPHANQTARLPASLEQECAP